MSDVIVGTIRTFVPALVGTILTFLANRGWDLGLEADAASAGIVAGVVALYYALVRILEQKYPWVGVFLGNTKQPHYDDGSGGGGGDDEPPAPYEPAAGEDPTDEEL